MNLVKLFEMQRALDEHIEREHPRAEGEDRLAKKILALQVELGELANELPEVFKFWSNKKNNLERALKEYVDCLHFILSIANELKIHISETYSFELSIPGPKTEVLFADITQGAFWFHSRQRITNRAELAKGWTYYFCSFIHLGERLGFTWEQIEQAYIEKNVTNHVRQESGY